MEDTIYVEKWIKDLIDTTIEFARKKQSPLGIVETEGDWEVVEKLFEVWAYANPDEFAYFKASVDRLKSMNTYSKGVKEESGGFMHHRMEVPERFYKLINDFFPNQNWSKEFTSKLVRRIPLLKVSGYEHI